MENDVRALYIKSATKRLSKEELKLFHLCCDLVDPDDLSNLFVSINAELYQ